MCYDHKPERLPPLKIASALLTGTISAPLLSQAAATIRDLNDECTGRLNAWGRITQALGIPWDSSSGKVLEEIRRLQKAITTCRRLASHAPQGDCSIDGLFERLAEIQKACAMKGAIPCQDQ